MITAQTPNPPKASGADPFGAAHLRALVQQLEGARVILRMVLLALHADENGSISHAGATGASRWSAAFTPVMNKLFSVRDILTETAHAPPLDWPTPFALASALDSALRDGYCTTAPVLTHSETQTALQVVIDALDDLLNECATAGGSHYPETNTRRPPMTAPCNDPQATHEASTQDAALHQRIENHVSMDTGTSGFQAQLGARTMTTGNTTPTPTTSLGNQTARLKAIENALSLELYYIRQNEHPSNIHAATVKAVRAASLLKQGVTESTNSGRA